MGLKIDTASFFIKSKKSIKEDYETSLICGKMGSGKTYLAIYEAEKYLKRKKTVITNITTYHSFKHEVLIFKDLGDLYDLIQKTGNSIIIIDECSKIFPKDCRVDKKFYEFLQHARKLNLHIFLIFQEYIMVPNWIRGVCDTVYTTNKFLFFCKTDIGTPVLDKDTYEWGMENFGCIIYKRNNSIYQLYDTYEVLLVN